MASYVNVGSGVGGVSRSYLPSKRIVFIGDSLTAGNPSPSNRWQAPLETSLTAALNGKAILFYSIVAVGGDTTTDMLGRVASVTALRPDYCIIMCGINDHWNHLGTPIPPATSASNVASEISTIKATSPLCKFWYVSGLWYGTENWPDGVGAEDSLVQATNAAIQAQVQATANCTWIDVRTPIYTIDAPALNPGHANSGVMSVDGTHPNSTGQTVISSRVFAQLPIASFGP